MPGGCEEFKPKLQAATLIGIANLQILAASTRSAFGTEDLSTSQASN
jgi:hypothetical protein